MADAKISALTSVTTPLAGTEVLPIVQSSSTKKVTVDNLTKGRTVNATTFDTDVAAAKVTLSGTTLAAAGSNTNIDINLTPKGTGEVNITKVDVDGGTVDGTVIGGTTAAAGTFTTLQHNNYQRWTIGRSTQPNQYLTLVWAGTKVFKGRIRIGVSYPFSSTAARAYHEFEIDANTAAGGGRVVYLRHDYSHADTTNYQGRVYYDSTTGTLTVAHLTIPNVEQDAVVEVFLTQGTMPDATPAWTTTVPAGTLQTASLEVINANVTVGTGNLIFGTSGKGIDFSATPGTGTSELLADYEEGTWTPVATSGTGAITTYTSSGTYTKIGRQVYVTGRITVTDAGTAGGTLLFAGLPFTLGAAGQGLAIEAALTGSTYFVNSSAGTTNGGIATGTLGAASWTNNSRYDFSMVYSA